MKRCEIGSSSYYLRRNTQETQAGDSNFLSVWSYQYSTCASYICWAVQLLAHPHGYSLSPAILQTNVMFTILLGHHHPTETPTFMKKVMKLRKNKKSPSPTTSLQKCFLYLQTCTVITCWFLYIHDEVFVSCWHVFSIMNNVEVKIFLWSSMLTWKNVIGRHG